MCYFIKMCYAPARFVFIGLGFATFDSGMVAGYKPGVQQMQGPKLLA